MGFNKTIPTAFRNFGLVDQEVEFITEWAASQPMIAVYLGSPYALTRIPGHMNFTAYIVGYTPIKPNNFAAAQLVFGGIPAKGVLPVTSASFNLGESVIIPDRYREEYIHPLGSEEDSLCQVVYDMKEKSAALTLLPQVAEIVASGKIRLTDSLAAALSDYKSAESRAYLKELLNRYRSCFSITDTATKMFESIGMRFTHICGDSVTTTGYDYNKYLFTLNNGGKYAGKQVISPEAAKLILKYL